MKLVNVGAKSAISGGITVALSYETGATQLHRVTEKIPLELEQSITVAAGEQFELQPVGSSR